MYKKYNDASDIYRCNDDILFKDFIRNILAKSKLKDRFIDILTNEKSLEIYRIAFTSSSAEPSQLKNYEVFEQLGDMTANKFLVWYFHRRFSELPVKTVARLRINYGSKQSFAKIADELGFWCFISAREDERSHSKKPLLEDTFEAFLGATESLCDDNFRRGIGYEICYSILKEIFDKMDISLRYEDLYDAKTRLKELVDSKTDLNVTYKDTAVPMVDSEYSYKECVISVYINGKYMFKCNGTGSIKVSAQQNAAECVLEKLKMSGYYKPNPSVYDITPSPSGDV